MDVVLEAMLRVGSRFPNVSNPPGTLAVQRREQALALARRARPAVDEKKKSGVKRNKVEEKGVRKVKEQKGSVKR